VAPPAVAERAGSRLFGLLFLCTFLLVGAQGIASPSEFREILVTALAGASLLLAFMVAELSPRLVTFAAVIAGAILTAMVVAALGADIGDGATNLMTLSLVALAPPALVLGIVRELRTAHAVRLQAVMGVLALYMLVGMMFAFGYAAIDRLGGDPFFAGGEAASASNCLYFSFTTLTTVGYGDLTARSDLGHTLAVYEALIGQIYLVTVVSLIVSNLGRPARRRLAEPADL
jgi:hypothetical protein